MKPGTMPNLFSFCCLHSLAIEESPLNTRLSNSDEEPAMMVLWKLSNSLVPRLRDDVFGQ